MADRSTYNESSSPMPNGLQFLEQYAHLFGLLFNTSVLPLTAVGGTGNAVTATLDPPLLGGLVTGMKFTLTFAAANTGPVTLALNGGAAVPMVDAAGLDLVAGDLDTGLRGLIEFVGGVFRLLSATGSSGGAAPYSTVITASTTWVKPAGYADDTLVRIQGWGAGGGGASGGGVSQTAGGGGGGAYKELIMRYADIPTSVVCTIGAGGVAGANGGNTTFGSLLTAFRGGGGSNGSGVDRGGGGGGELSGGGTGTPGAAGEIGGGTSSQGSNTASKALTIWGGGAGGSNGSVDGGSAVFGAAGGGARSNTTSASQGGTSLYGGQGGAGVNGTGSAGTAPGGGGGGGATGGAGARGEIRIQILG